MIAAMAMILTQAFRARSILFNGRGANQWSHWVRINGQVYALWYNGQFGEDNLYLLRPFGPSGSTPAVTIRYRYTLNDIRSPEKTSL